MFFDAGKLKSTAPGVDKNITCSMRHPNRSGEVFHSNSPHQEPKASANMRNLFSKMKMGQFLGVDVVPKEAFCYLKL